MLDKYSKQVNLVFKNFPLPNHQFARKASAAALAANRQAKFWEFNHNLFENYSSLNDAKIQEIAKALGLNMEKFNKDMADPALQQLINRDINEGNQARIRGTPTIFVNGKTLEEISPQGLAAAIESELQKKQQK